MQHTEFQVCAHNATKGAQDASADNGADEVPVASADNGADEVPVASADNGADEVPVASADNGAEGSFVAPEINVAHRATDIFAKIVADRDGVPHTSAENIAKKFLTLLQTLWLIYHSVLLKFELVTKSMVRLSIIFLQNTITTEKVKDLNET
ncbi:hypothetical protein OTU49_014656 [Cherax quadricarinatus]|uniref:Uncharacterized protein n=1 Tax=Cherax quadricarinatus TaxID=27406 RepID=A0AAW0VPQ6_CHEQU